MFGGASAAVLGSVLEKRILLARSNIADPHIASHLRQAGADLTDLAIYSTVRPDALPPDAVDALREDRVDWVTFTSASTVDNFVALAKAAGVEIARARPQLAAIGPATADRLAGHGLAPAVVAEPHTTDALADAIIAARPA